MECVACICKHKADLFCPAANTEVHQAGCLVVCRWAAQAPKELGEKQERSSHKHPADTCSRLATRPARWDVLAPAQSHSDTKLQHPDKTHTSNPAETEKEVQSAVNHTQPLQILPRCGAQEGVGDWRVLVPSTHRLPHAQCAHATTHCETHMQGAAHADHHTPAVTRTRKRAPCHSHIHGIVYVHRHACAKSRACLEPSAQNHSTLASYACIQPPPVPESLHLSPMRRPMPHPGPPCPACIVWTP
jgi:hypothetical protein